MPALQSFYAQPRFYSAGAGVAEHVRTKDEASGLITRFADLSQLGVHPAIVRSIVQGMKYEDMTPVQSKTIRPALAGKDL